MQIAIGGMVLLAGSFVWTGMSIVCPKCQLKLFFHALRNKGFFVWFSCLLLGVPGAVTAKRQIQLYAAKRSKVFRR